MVCKGLVTLASGYRSIDVAIDKDGKVHIKTSGFSGQTCLKEAERLIALLQQAGLDVKTEDLKLTEEAMKVAEKGSVRAERK